MKNLEHERTTGVNKKEITPRPQYHLSGDKCRLGLLPHKFPSLARLCRANNPVNCLVFLFESYARVIEKGLRVGLFPARG
ncbi:hypothetical protein IJ579_07540, partial [bacterium]|nr:hypothetical protein [bacterium]